MARGLVIATAACLLFAIAVATGVLSHGSGTYTAILVFAPLLLLPGILVWFHPQSRFLALWGVWSFIVSLPYLIGASPYSYERELAGWAPIQWAMWTAIVLAIVGSSIVAFATAASERTPPPASSRTRRIQQATRLSLALAVVTIVVSFVALGAPLAANFWNVAFIAFVVAPAPYVHRVATRGSTITWAAWTSPYAAIMAILSVTLDHAEDLEQSVRMSMLSYGTLLTMICLVIPLVAFISSDDVSDLPSARVH